MEEVAKRELFEETGLEARNLELFDVFSGKDLFEEIPGELSPPDKPVINNEER